MPDDDMVSSLLSASDMLSTWWFAADAARAWPGETVAIVDDNAVDLMAVLTARGPGHTRLGAGR